jgi:hypothetical protein
MAAPNFPPCLARGDCCPCLFAQFDKHYLRLAERGSLTPESDGSLADYTGGVICTLANPPECVGLVSSFNAHDHGYSTNDDLTFGSVTEAEPVPLVNISIKPGRLHPYLSTRAITG